MNAVRDTAHLEINMGGFPSADSQASMIAALTNGWVKFILFKLKFNVLAIIHLDYCETITQHCQSIMTTRQNSTTIITHSLCHTSFLLNNA